MEKMMAGSFADLVRMSTTLDQASPSPAEGEQR
jgi:hypothetical protein